MSTRRWLAGSGCVAVLGIAAVMVGMACAAMSLAALRATRPPPLRPTPVAAPDGYTVEGIDVSHHQGAIDWPTVAGSGRVDFVYIKATEGRSHVDRRFHRNWDAAHAEGLPTGAYHYFSLCRTGAEQAAHFIATVPRVEGALPPVVDVEPDSRCNRGSRWDHAAREVTAWLQAVEDHYGARPVVYASDSIHRLELSALDAERWVASYSRPPRADWTLWQHTDRGAVPGILGRVDQNVLRGPRHQDGRPR